MIRSHLLLVALLSAPRCAQSTYSIIAVDHTTGAVGCAVTSCVGTFGVDIVCGGHPGAGVVAAQAFANEDGRDRALDLLREEKYEAEEIVDEITKSSFDADNSQRQYGVCAVASDDKKKRNRSCSSFTGSVVQDCYGTPELYPSCYAGSTDLYLDRYAVSFQGNVITSENTLEQAKAAFVGDDETSDTISPKSLADRLMSALLAGADNCEGDVRCRVNSDGRASDSAHLFVATLPETSGEENYSLSVAGTGARGEAVELLREKYEAASGKSLSRRVRPSSCPRENGKTYPRRQNGRGKRCKPDTSIWELVVCASGEKGVDKRKADFDILRDLIAAANLRETIADLKDITLFMPNDRAFQKLAKDFGYRKKTYDEEGIVQFLVKILSDMGDLTEVLKTVITYHFGEDAYSFKELKVGKTIKTLQGGTFRSVPNKKGNSAILRDEEPTIRNPIIQTKMNDLETNQGRVHVITRILIPADLAATRSPSSMSDQRGGWEGFHSTNH